MKKILLSSTLCAVMAFGAADVLPVEKRTFTQSQFIPDISLIMDMSFVNRSVTDQKAKHLEMPGVAHGLLGSHDHGSSSHATYNANNGFNLNYAELVLSSSVDPFFTMDGVFHFSEHGVEIEELYFTTTALGYGTRVKGGKFNSNFGYLNEQHHHYWDFNDMPLVYESFLGMHGINEKGVQFQWTAPTSTYLMLGVEVLQGENEQMFGNEEMDLKDINGTTVSAADAPSLFIAYAKSSFDIDDTTILGGLSYAQGKSRISHMEHEDLSDKHAFKADSKIYGVDLVVKHNFDSYSSLKWQSEWLMRDMDGKQYNAAKPNGINLTKKQAGIYSQLVYAYDQSWKIGARYDNVYQNDVKANGTTKDMPTNMDKYTAMLEYSTSEFARFRLQYDRNNALFNEDDVRQNIDTIMLQVNISIGAHGAHSF